MPDLHFMQRLISGLHANPTSVICICAEELGETLLADGWPEGAVFGFAPSGMAQMPRGVRPVPQEGATKRLLRYLTFLSEPADLPYVAAPVILLGLWKQEMAGDAVFAYPGVAAERLFAARELLTRSCEAVLLRRDDGPASAIALARNTRNERMLAHWVDLLEQFSLNPRQQSPFDASIPARMVEYLCDRVGSIRQPLSLAAASKKSMKMAELVRTAVREMLPDFPDLREDPVGNALRYLNAPSAKVTQEPGNLITNLAHSIWSNRNDLQAAFDLDTSDGRKGLVDWLFSRGPIELELTDEYLDPIRTEREHPVLPVPAPKPVAPEQPAVDAAKGVNLVGYPRAEMGMGELLRQSAAGFSAANVPFCLVDFNFGLIASQCERRYEHLLRPDNPYAINLLHINAHQILVVREQLGPEFFRNRYNIGYWAWELSNFPDEWQDAIDLMDEIWAPSRFVQDAIAKATSKPVLWMPLAVEFPEPESRDRKKFGLPENAFLFLFTFDFSSFAARKNCCGCIEAFQRAFPKGDEAGLVIKTIRHPHHRREFWDVLRAMGDDKRIFLIDRVLRRPELHELIAACDSFVSLHRSEGFGLGIAEAMYLGKPVVATNYSGNTDFTKPDNSCLVDYSLIPVKAGEYLFPEGQVWADPDRDQAAMYMRRLLEDSEYRERIGAAAAEFIRRQHSAQAIGARYAKRLRQIAAARSMLASVRQ